MVARIARFLVFLLALSVFLPPVTGSGQIQLATTASKPSEPQPSRTVAIMLDNARRLAEAKQPVDSLKAADQALEAARQSNDTIGLALAQEARAKVLPDLERADEALTAWQEAARIWSGDDDLPKRITALVQAGLLCVANNKKNDAERFFAQSLSIGKAKTQHPEAVAQALYDSGIAIGDRRQEPMAMEYLTTVLAMREKLAPESLEVVKTLNALAKYARNRGIRDTDSQYYSLGKSYATRAIEMSRRIAPDSSLMAESLRRLGLLDLDASADPVAAREHYLAALRIEKKIAPDGSMLQAEILHDLGEMEAMETNFAVAREYLDEAVAIGERMAPESLPLAGALEALGNLESNEADLSAARIHIQRALGIKEKLHANPGGTWINLGNVVLEQNDFAAAREYFEKALAFFKQNFPKTSGIAVALENLSDTYHEQGDQATALEYGQRALAKYEEKLGVSSNTAETLGLIGDILREQGKFSAAADYYKRSLDMWQTVVPGSLHVSHTLANLARLERARGNRSIATEYDHQALDIGQKSCPNSWCVTGILNDLGELAYEQGDLAGSESYLGQAVDIREKSLGPMHPDLARSLNSLALTVAALGRTPEALGIALRAERIGAEHLRISVRTLSERQALAYEGIRASGLDLALTLAANRANTPLARGAVFDAVIRSRALVFDELAARHRSAYKSRDPEVARLADQLLTARTRLATLVFRGVGDMKPEAYRNLLNDARAEKEKAELALAEKSIVFRQDEARAQIGIREIAESLPQGTTLVAFVRYKKHDLQKPRSGEVVPEPVASYAAFVLRAGGYEPALVQLGAAREIETRLTAWRLEIARQADAPDVRAKTGEDVYIRFGAALRRRIWDPLVPSLGDVKKIFVVPDAALHLISLDALPSSSSRYLIETGPLIQYLSTERDLVPVQSRRGEGILVVGNPAFDQASSTTLVSGQQSTPTGVPPTATVLLRGSRSGCGTFKTLHFPPLPASQQEVDNIAALWKRSTASVSPAGELLQMTGAEASPDAFERYAPGKRVVHVATHGFFLQGSCQSEVQLSLDANKPDESFLPTTADNPLLLSGLAFAGANRRASAGTDQADGILTAEEISGINLEGLDWAVLSACDTGVGEIKVGEGVFGLRRAFQVAGAKTVIMSLWQVEDETTRQWMETLYREHFLNGKDTGESVRAASLQILRQRRAKHQNTHPFYWAAFIAAGDWH